MEVAVAVANVVATIKIVLDYLLLYPIEEIDFKGDLQKLKQSFFMILHLVQGAEMKHVTDWPVILWLQKLEAFAYDADYVFDQLNYQLIRKKVESDYKEKKLQVSSSLSTYVPFSFRYKMARKIKDIKKTLKSINEEARDLGLQMQVSGAQARGVGIKVPANLETNPYAVDRVFFGRENDVTEIVEMLINSTSNEHAISVLPILGMGGLGKTTFARKVFSHADIVSNFGKRMWVHVHENFDPVIVLRSVVASSTGENVDGSREVVLHKLEKSLENKRYLLVLDDVWNVINNEWYNFIASLQGINSVKGNVIMVTTRSGNVASIVKTLDSHELGVLSAKDCWLIIKAEAFGGETIPSQFEASGANIATRCGGLPLAAQVVGSFLRGKSKDEWVSIEKKWLSDFSEDEDTVSKVLKLSFDNLPSPSLKKCFALYSFIPRSLWIDKDELIQLWMAEGFLQIDKETDMEIVGDKVLNLLVQSSLIEVRRKDYYGNVERCGMHNLMHDLASSILNPKFSDTAYQARYLTKPHIDVLSSMPKKYAKCLRALAFEGEASQIMFSNFKYLHVLILVDEDIDKLPIEIGKLISLRYLDISHTRIESLPDSIGDLYHLQTLRAIIEYGRTTYLRKLPDTFKYLISLRHLHIPNIKLPPKIGKLTCLRTLPYFQVGDEEGCGIMELGSLKNLKGEIEIHNLEKVGDKEEAMSADLFHKPNLLKLKLVWNKGRQGESNDADVLEGLQPHPNLKILEIDGFKGRSFPQWTSRMAVGEVRRWVILDNLIEVRLSDCEECEEIPMLGHLPHLKSLYLHNLANVKSMGSSFYGICTETVKLFPMLEKLELIGMAELTSWEGVGVELPSSSWSQPRQVSVFACLEYLRIIDCKKLESAPSHFPRLKELEVINMESGVPVANICGGSNLSSLRTLRIESVDGLERLPDNLFSNNRDLLEVKIRNCNKLEQIRALYDFEENGIDKKTDNVFPVLKYLQKLELIGLAELTSWEDIEPPSSSQSQLRQVSLFHRLEYLKIIDCKKLKSAPRKFQCLKELEVNNMRSRIPLVNICGGSNLSSLRKLRIESVDGLERLPDKLFFNNRDLSELEIKKCDNLKELVPSLRGGGASLRKMNIEKCSNFEKLPDDLHRLNAIEELIISGCPNLKSIPYPENELLSSQGFHSLRKLEISFCGVTELPIKMIESCTSSLEALSLRGSRSIRNFLLEVMFVIPDMPRLRSLLVEYVPYNDVVVAGIGPLLGVTELGIGGFPYSGDYDAFSDRLDRIFPALQSLRHLVLVGMKEWDALPYQLQHLTTLQSLWLFDFGIEELPEWFRNLSSLKLFGLWNCQRLKRLPSKEGMQSLTKLTRLNIYACPLLRQSLETDANDADSGWSKISHIPAILLDEKFITAPAQ